MLDGAFFLVIYLFIYFIRYCTFGDACKFMHDRGDYKSGWELDRDWKLKEEKEKRDALQVRRERERERERESKLKTH